MKKLLFFLAFTMFFAAANAQDGQGRRDPAQMKEMMKKRLVEEVKLSEQLADSVVTIQFEYQMEARKLRQETSMSDDDKKAATQKLSDARDAKLKGILTAEQFQELQAYNEKMRKEREARMQNRN